MRIVTLLSLALASIATAADIVPPDAKLEKIFDGGLVLTEGVAVAPDGMVYFSDITFTHVSRAENKPIEAGHIWKFDPTTGKATIFRSPSGMSNGLKFDADGNLLAAEGADYGGRRVTRTDMKTGKSYIIAGLFEGKPFNAPNDITIDEKGRIYFSDPRYLGHEPIDQPVQAVYRIDPDGIGSSHHHRCGQAERRRGLARPEDAVRGEQRQRHDRHRPAEERREQGRRADAEGADGADGLRPVAGRDGEVPQDAGRLRPAGRARRAGVRHGREPVRRGARREPAGHRRLFAGREGAGVHQDGDADQRRLRPRGG